MSGRKKAGEMAGWKNLPRNPQDKRKYQEIFHAFRGKAFCWIAAQASERRGESA